MRRLFPWVLLIAVLALAGCGSQIEIDANSNTNNGVFAVTQPGDYQYTVGSPDCGTNYSGSLLLTDPNGQTENLDYAGDVNLTAGTYRAACDVALLGTTGYWSLTLTYPAPQFPTLPPAPT